MLRATVVQTGTTFASGKGDFSPLWAGQNVRGYKAIPAAELSREIAGHLG